MHARILFIGRRHNLWRFWKFRKVMLSASVQETLKVLRNTATNKFKYIEQHVMPLKAARKTSVKFVRCFDFT
jgi:hypothetical protein